MKVLTFFVTLFVLAEYGEAGFRCGFLGGTLGITGACRVSCLAQGHTTGFCDLEGNCNCSEVDLDISESFKELLNGRSITQYVKDKMQEFRDEVNSWEITQSIRDVTPSRCRVSDDFCNDSCRSIGWVGGKCSPDNSDCECDDERVSAAQWATCLVDDACTVSCQSQGYARGECQGQGSWDCKCISNRKGGEQGQQLDIDAIADN